MAYKPAAPALKKEGRPRPWTFEVPKNAPRYPSTEKRPNPAGGDPFSRGLASGYADVFPWHGGNGKHHEDDWSSEAIQKGTWDRGNQNETSTARMTIAPAIKQKTGLSALSTIFNGVHNQRRHRGRVTAPSTFKPPPRVTLTDTKREGWMRDLANPSISLRRLSRTIPHGIRGRHLLDQCLNKSIPTERAVWLIKCVGANEIRAFKRKGAPGGALAMAGEAKWNKDWTVVVEQFIESVVSLIGEPDWEAKLNYAIQLATNLYNEKLLDRDHYLDWITSSVEHSPQSRVPMWILIAKICWVDILRSRKHGRRLVYSLLAHLQAMSWRGTAGADDGPEEHLTADERREKFREMIRTYFLDKDTLQQLPDQLSDLLTSLIKDNADSFIDPGLWPKYKPLLDIMEARGDKVAREAYRRVHVRNGQLSITSSASLLAGRPQLVRLLDSTLLGFVAAGLPEKCWATGDDKVDIVKTTVDWATSFYRPGLARVYFAAKLFGYWSTPGVNLTGLILEHMDTISVGDEGRKQAVYRLVTELVRTSLFSVPQYLQWLVARGACSDPSEVDSDDAPCTTRLLVHLPIHYLTDDQKEDRADLLRRANYSTVEEARDLGNAVLCVNYVLGVPLSQDAMADRQQISLRKLVAKILSSSRALQTTVGLHLCDTFKTLVNTFQPVPPRLFLAVRTILEATQDFYALSDVLMACSKTTNFELLTSCADTVNLHLQVFCAQGSASGIFEALHTQYTMFCRQRGFVVRPLLASLCFLSRRMPGREGYAKSLARDLARSDRNNATDACSPISDNIFNPPSGADCEVSEQIEKLLASGNSIDHPTMNRLFGYVIRRLEASWAKMDDNRRLHASLLTRLRLFNSQHFDKLMADWVGRVRLLKSRKRLDAVFPLLIITDALPIACLVSPASWIRAANVADAEAAAFHDRTLPGAVTYLQELLHLLLSKLPTDTGLSQEEAYRFGIYQQAIQFDHHNGLLSLIGQAIVEYGRLRSRHDNIELPLDNGTFRERVLDVLRLLVVMHTAEATEVFSAKTMPPAGLRLAHELVSNLFEQEGDQSASSASPYDQILRLANELTMPFCQIKINMDLSTPLIGNDEDDKQQSPSQFDLFSKAMDRAIEAQNIVWTTMLPCLTGEISRHSQSQARSRFLDLVPSSSSLSKNAGSIHETLVKMHNDLQLAEKLLGVIEAIVVGQQPSSTAPLTSVLADKLSDLVEIVVAPRGREDKMKGVRIPIIEHWLPMLLKFVLLHSVSSEPLSASVMTTSVKGKLVLPPHHEARAHTLLSLCRLFLALEAVPGQVGGPSLLQQVFDIATVLADGLPDDLRIHCAKSILLLPGMAPNMRLSSDARLFYILSAPQLTTTDGFMIAHKEKTAMPQSTAARGMGAMYGVGPTSGEKLSPFVPRRWEMLSEPTPNVGVNDTSLNLGLFDTIRLH